MVRLRIVPNAKRNEVVGPYGEAIKVKVAAPALEGKANAELLEFLAEKAGLPNRSVTLISGEKSRDKAVQFEGIAEAEVRERLLCARQRGIGRF